MTRRANLSYDMSVKNLKWKQGDPEQIRFRDTDRMGFYIRVSKNNTKTWEYRYPVGDRKYRYLRLGNYPRLSCTDALEKFKSAVEDVKVSGVDPKQITSKNLTLNALFEQYLERYAKKKKKSWKEDEDLYDLHVKKPAFTDDDGKIIEIDFGNKQATQITIDDIVIIVRRLEDSDKLHTARKTLAVLRKMFNWASSPASSPSNGHGALLKILNPCQGVESRKPLPPELHDLHEDVIQTIWTDLPDTAFGRVVKLLLLTGCRVSEIVGIHSREIDRRAVDLILPKERTKNKRKHVIPLTPRMVELIGSETNGFIFPAKSKTGHIDTSTIRNYLGEACLRLGIDHVRPSDFRDTFISKLARLGVGLEIRNSLTNHIDRSVDRVNYNDYDFYTEKKNALRDWDEKVTEIISKDGKVI